MATNNSVNSPLSGTTGSGNFVGATSPIVTGLTSNQITWSDTTKGIVGTTTNDNAAAGYVGEYTQTSLAGPVSFSVTSTAYNIDSISLTAGDWDVNYGFLFISSGAVPPTTLTGVVLAGISTVSATLSNYVGAETTYFSSPNQGSYNNGSTLSAFGSKRLSLSATTTVYLVGSAQFTGSAPAAFGQLTARRRR
jgi:hypothetical protein